MTENKNLTQKILVAKSLAYLEELKDSDILNTKENQLLIINGYKNTLEALSKRIEEVELLEEKLNDKQKQVNLLINFVEELRSKKK